VVWEGLNTLSFSLSSLLMVPTTLQNSLTLIFRDKMNSFPGLICSHEIPLSAFNRLQSH